MKLPLPPRVLTISIFKKSYHSIKNCRHVQLLRRVQVESCSAALRRASIGLPWPMTSPSFAVAAGNNDKRTALHRVKSVKMLHILLQHGAMLETQDRFGATPLLEIVRHQYDVDVVSAMVEAGANVHAADLAGNTVLHLARGPKALQ